MDQRQRGRPDSVVTNSIIIAVAIALTVIAIAGIVLVRWKSRHAGSDAASSSDAAVESSVIATSDDDAGAAAAADAAAASSANANGEAQRAALAERRLNVILITIDTLRSDLGYAGYARPVSPNLDALAARSTVFERAYATAPYTMKALMALLTGRFTSEALRDYQHYTHYFPSNVFLAERIKATGDASMTRTVAVMCHRYFGMKPGFEQGFDVFDLSAIPPNMTDSDPRPTSQGLTDVALSLLGKPENAPTSDRRLFAWIHYFDPHSPYVGHPGAPAFEKMDPSTSLNRSRDIYDNEVWFTDLHIGRLIDFVTKSTWGNDTAIIVTADHGEAFGEKEHWRHGRELWEPIVRVPLILYVPGLSPRRVGVKRSHIDVVPTILELMAIGANSEQPALRGKSLMSDVFTPDGGTLEERDVFMDVPEGQMNDPRRGILTGPTPGLKLIDRAKKGIELYDLATDAEEANNLATSDASRLAEARARYDAFISTLDELKPVR